MSYRFRLILTHFDARGTTLSYFLGSSRTENEPTRYRNSAIAPTGTADRYRYDKTKSGRHGYDNWTHSKRRLESLRRPDRYQERRARSCTARPRHLTANKPRMPGSSKREAELKRPGGLEHKEDPLLAAVIDRYIEKSKSPVSGTKAQVPRRRIKNSDLGETKCSDITSQRLVSFARELTKTVEPQTCGNYFSHLSNIFTVARPAWGYPLSRQEFDRRHHPAVHMRTDANLLCSLHPPYAAAANAGAR